MIASLLRRRTRRLALPRLLDAFAEAYPRAVFVEIGSNDGEQHDHLRPLILGTDWTGVMVEPVPYVFDRLRRNYGGIERVTLENAAVGTEHGTLPFFHLVDASEQERRELPDWYDGIGSLSEQHLLAHAKHMPDIRERIVRREVPAYTFESLCEKHGLSHVNLLVIDTEGYDWQLLQRIDFSARPPELVVYEHFHLPRDDRAAAAAHLQQRGYATMEEGFDTFALHRSADARLLRLWSGLRPGAAGVSVEDEE
jgi:FkbM family methyltransferase